MTLTAISPTSLETVSSCSFCQSEIVENQKIYEDDQVIVLYDYKPVIQGHCLVIPKRHVERLEEVKPSEMLAMHQSISNLYKAAQKAYGSTGYLIFQKNGKEAGQSVPHVHFHFFPRKEGDYTDIGMYARLFFNQFQRPLSKESLDVERNRLSSHFAQPISTKALEHKAINFGDAFFSEAQN